MNRITEEITNELDLELDMPEDEIKSKIDEELSRYSKKRPLTIDEREKVRNDVFHNIRQLGVLQDFLDDSSVTEIMVNGTEGIFVERNGISEQVPVKFDSIEKLKKVIWQITADCNRTVNEASPIVDARLLDGSRVNVVLDPIALNGPILTIRRFPQKAISMDDYLKMGNLTEECANFLKKSVEDGLNILVSGGTGSGKTTFLNVLSNFIPSSQRVITIEDSAELQLQGIKNLVRLETRNANVEGCREITIRDLIKTSLRMRPDRIIVGEVRSKEAIDMLQSVNVGHSGMTTVHANSARDVISRLETMVLTGMDIPISAVRKQISAGFDLMIHLSRLKSGERKIMEIVKVEGYKDGDVSLRTLYRYEDFKNTGKETGRLMKVGEY